jgi:hypothetical protein
MVIARTGPEAEHEGKVAKAEVMMGTIMMGNRETCKMHAFVSVVAKSHSVTIPTGPGMLLVSAWAVVEQPKQSVMMGTIVSFRWATERPVKRTLLCQCALGTTGP